MKGDLTRLSLLKIRSIVSRLVWAASLFCFVSVLLGALFWCRYKYLHQEAGIIGPYTLGFAGFLGFSLGLAAKPAVLRAFGLRGYYSNVSHLTRAVRWYTWDWLKQLLCGLFGFVRKPAECPLPPKRAAVVLRYLAAKYPSEFCVVSAQLSGLFYCRAHKQASKRTAEIVRRMELPPEPPEPVRPPIRRQPPQRPAPRSSVEVPIPVTAPEPEPELVPVTITRDEAQEIIDRQSEPPRLDNPAFNVEDDTQPDGWLDPDEAGISPDERLRRTRSNRQLKKAVRRAQREGAQV